MTSQAMEQKPSALAPIIRSACVLDSTVKTLTADQLTLYDRQAFKTSPLQLVTSSLSHFLPAKNHLAGIKAHDALTLCCTESSKLKYRIKCEVSRLCQDSSELCALTPVPRQQKQQVAFIFQWKLATKGLQQPERQQQQSKFKQCCSNVSNVPSISEI